MIIIAPNPELSGKKRIWHIQIRFKVNLWITSLILWVDTSYFHYPSLSLLILSVLLSPSPMSCCMTSHHFFWFSYFRSPLISIHLFSLLHLPLSFSVRVLTILISLLATPALALVSSFLIFSILSTPFTLSQSIHHTTIMCRSPM